MAIQFETAPAARALPFRHLLGETASATDISALTQALGPVIKRYLTDPPAPARAVFSLAERRDDLNAIQAFARGWRERYTTLLVIGAGGSGLGGKALAMLACGVHPCGTHALHALDTLDMHCALRFLNQVDLERCCFLIVSKSGSTVETYAQTRFILELLKQKNVGDLPARMAAITVPGANPLRELAQDHGIPVFDHDEALGGRFSLLSAVGLIPAAFMQLDIHALRDGAACALETNLDLLAGEPTPAMVGAALQVAQMQAGRNISVFMPYSAQFYGLGLWWRQSWAESLGKDGKGSTPLLALGTADQHSQLQLFLGGADDKCYTLLLTDCAGSGPKLPEIQGQLSYLSGHSLGDLLSTQQRATLGTLEHHRRPVRIFEVKESDEFTLGALVMQLTLEIVLAAELLGINAFDQPAVEESKRLAHEYLLR